MRFKSGGYDKANPKTHKTVRWMFGNRIMSTDTPKLFTDDIYIAWEDEFNAWCNLEEAQRRYGECRKRSDSFHSPASGIYVMTVPEGDA